MWSSNPPRRNNRRALLALALGGLVAALAGPALAETPEARGLAIALEAERRDTGWNDYTADQRMVLRNAQGQESSRELHFSSLEMADDGDRSMIVFDQPRDIDGTALLTFTHEVGDDDQWLYLPATRRVRRISAANRSGSFVGSEFAYEDLTSQETEKYDWRWLRDEALDDMPCFVVERAPVYENSGYTRQVVWIDQQHYRTMRVDYYNRRDELMKTLTFTGYNLYLDEYWRADRLDMVNHQTGKSTELSWSNYRFRTGLDEGDFNRNSLQRAR